MIHRSNIDLQRLARRLRRAATRCGCRSMTGTDVQGPSTQRYDTSAGHGYSSRQGAQSGAHTSSLSTRSTFSASGSDNAGDQAEEIGPSQMPDAPSTQTSQPRAHRRRRAPDQYTPGTDALGAKGKGKARKQ